MFLKKGHKRVQLMDPARNNILQKMKEVPKQWAQASISNYTKLNLHIFLTLSLVEQVEIVHRIYVYLLS